MIAVFVIAYVAVVLAVFKVFKVRPTAISIAGVVVIGAIAIGGIVIAWSFSAPFSDRVVVARFVVPIVPQVNGPVIKIHALPNTPLKGGQDLLLEIQPDIFRNTVDQLTAALAAAKRNIDQLQAAAIAAEAAVRRADALKSAADAEFQVASNAAQANPSAIATLRLEQLAQNLMAAEAGVDQAKATGVQATIASFAAEETARSLEAQLANAQFQLDQCKVFAPSDGFVTNWTVREGVMATPSPQAPLGTFVDTSQVLIVGSYPQNVLVNVKPGDSVELTFKTLPGQVLAGTVGWIIPWSGEGQLMISGNLPSAAQVGSRGMLAVNFELEDQELAAQLKMGTAGVATIYTDTGKPIQFISRVVIRVKAFQYLLLPF
ncbi:HlyD family secretion protein [Pirellulaceae bacterium SH449]